MALSVALALLAAALFAMSAAVQQYAARSIALAGRFGTVSLLVRLVGNPWWLAGWVANVVGFGLHAVALHHGSIAVVQAVLVVQLLFALPLAAVPTRRWPLRRDWLGMAAVCTGLISLLVIRGGIPQTTARRADVPEVAAVAAGLVILLVLLSRLLRRHAQTRTAVVAVASGICISMTAVFLVFVTDDLAKRGLFAALHGLPVLGLAASTVLGLVLIQKSFASGSLATALTATTITDPLTSWISGGILFDVRPPLAGGTLVAGLLAGGLVVAGVALLANSPTLHDERQLRAPAADPSVSR